ncbi:MAG: PKD domain-containing protein [Flavobacteriales bacterium]|nr:PKD domain-containing protein [Flavobacteriales bacterium]MCB9168711.1 PKD domain-containing protein [Flavobacteriales bacterium]
MTLRPFLAGACAFTAILFSAPPCHGQISIVIGTGQSTTGQNQYPSPYGNLQPGSRHQVLLLASELTAAGMSAGDILGMGFHVAVPNSTTLTSFTVSIGTTTVSAMSQNWITGLSPVWGPQDLVVQSGWVDHPFNAPFYWDGASNLVVETCFHNTATSNNAQMYYTLSGFSSVTYRATPNQNVCTSPNGQLFVSAVRPDIRFDWLPPNTPPSAAFSISAPISCSGGVQFTDASLFFPTGWSWDLGDGSTDTVQNPYHLYASDGSYDVTLIATNAFGSDTVTIVNAVTIAQNGPQPVQACTPLSTPTIAGFGILAVDLNGTVMTSGDALGDGGYLDRGCILDTIVAGTTFQIGVTTGTITTHNVRAWVDWDNSGTFGSGEEVLLATSVNSASNALIVPANAVLQTPLRVRVMADYDFSPALQACNAPQYGQTEDYGLVVMPNFDAPIADFAVDHVFTCDGQVQFSDQSLNGPTGWTWSFGDGGTSNNPSPGHTYTSSGIYTVTLIATNANGTDTLTLTDLVTVDLDNALPPAACTPQTQSYCCGYGLLGFAFAGISSTSPDGVEGYQDRSCGNTAMVIEGQSYPATFDTGDQNDQDTYLWIDLDNDGSFSNSELVFFALAQTDPSAQVQVPLGMAYNTPLRARVSTDVIGAVNDPCDPPLFGQVEDFSVIVQPNPFAPQAQFSASPTTTCDGVVQFFDGSLNLPLDWLWDFGDGTTSTDQSPQHIYANTGTYTVSLTVTNTNGTDQSVQLDLITYLESVFCDTTVVPGNGQLSLDACFGTLVDDGGPNANYSPGNSAAVTIAPPNAQNVTLTFSEFAFEPNFDFLSIYDGPNTFSPLIGSYSGIGLGALPNGGVITSSGGSITVRQEASNGQITFPGFIAQWSCTTTGIPSLGRDPVAMLAPVPTSGPFRLELNSGASKDWWVTINDLLGELLSRRDLTPGERVITFDASSWPSGCYSVVLHTPEGTWQRPILVQ